MITKDEIKKTIARKIANPYTKGSNYLFVDIDHEIMIVIDQYKQINTNDVLEFFSHQSIAPSLSRRTDLRIQERHGNFDIAAYSFIPLQGRGLDDIMYERIINEYPREKPYNRFYDAITELNEFVDDVYDCMLLEHI